VSLLLDLLFPRRCYSCGQSGTYLCPSCSSGLTPDPFDPHPPSPLAGRLSLFPYQAAVRSLILDLKYSFVSDLVPTLADLACGSLQHHFPHILKYWQENAFSLVPLPLHPFRQNWRGFNQTTLLGKFMAEKLELTYLDILIRAKFTASQTQVPKPKRPQNVSQAFKLSSDFTHKQGSANFILFDDVYTTGSTMVSAALSFPPGSNLWALTLAS